MDCLRKYQMAIEETRNFEPPEAPSTLTPEERQIIWDLIEKLGYELSDLKGLAQNPMVLSRQDVTEWQKSVEQLREHLEKMRLYVKTIVLSRI
jgi:hypothetical protein